MFLIFIYIKCINVNRIKFAILQNIRVLKNERNRIYRATLNILFMHLREEKIIHYSTSLFWIKYEMTR